MLRSFALRIPSGLRHLRVPAYSLSYSTIPNITNTTATTTTAKMPGSAIIGGHSKKHKVTIVGSGNWYVHLIM